MGGGRVMHRGEPREANPFALLIRNRARTKAVSQQVMPAESIEGFPLSEQQKRVCSLSRSNGRAALGLKAVVSIRGAADGEILEALRSITARHEILRTRIHSSDAEAEPVQVIGPESGGLFRWRLEPSGESVWKLAIEFAPGGGDHTSIQLLLQELAAALDPDRPPAGPGAEPMQYADYAQWQSELLAEDKAGQSFWTKSQIAGEFAFRLPLEPAAAAPFQPASVTIEIPEALRETLRSFDSEKQIEAILLAAWCALLSRASALPELVIGVHAPGRGFEELKSALGPYDRFLPIRFCADETQTLLQSAETLAKAISKARSNADYFSAAAPGGAAPLPLLFSAPPVLAPIRAGKLVLEIEEIQPVSEPFKLHLELLGADRLRLWHDASRVSAPESQRLAARLLHFLASARGAAPRETAHLPPAEAQLLRQFGHAARPREVRPVLELFARAADRRPDAPAVVCGQSSLTYRELDRTSAALARQLRQAGVQPGSAAGLSATRSVELIAGMLAIMKAGAAYVPLDPGYPKDRLAHMLNDSGMRVILAQPALQNSLPAEGIRFLPLELNPEEPAEPNPGAAPSGEDLAYIIYTSGSTGRPKGVIISHQNLAVSTAARLEYYPEPVSNYLLLSSFAFDSSIAGIFWTLAEGGTLTLPEEGAHQDPAEILRLIRNGRASHILALPSLYQAILERAAAEDIEPLRTVIVAGEACPRPLVREHFARAGHAALYNEYGPTEGTVWSTVHRCAPDEPRENVPIGRPVPGMDLFILDPQGRPAGIGVIGEIHISGPALAKGYLNQPELTAARFITGPGGIRLYKTGDLGCFLEDGLIEFRGRADHQVKIRGHRIELSEIEALLRRQPGIKEAVVIAREDAPGDQRLAAYYLAQSPAPDAASLRAALEAALPKFMVPSAFVALPRWPLTPNGKLDRNALPAPETAEPCQRGYAAPASADEEILAGIFESLLHRGKVGRHDHFFDLGGHSLLVLKLAARVRDAFRVELPLKDIFQKPTVAGVAEAIARCRASGRAGSGPIKRSHRRALTREELERIEQTEADAAGALANAIPGGKGD